MNETKCVVVHKLITMRLLAVSLTLLCTACATSGPTPTPMTSVKHELEVQGDGARAKCLVLFLPGVGDTAAHFDKHGFTQAMRDKGLSVDMVAADATIGYYMKGLMPEQYERDVAGPARAKGYEHTWVIGTSMGGLGTALYSRAHPVDGVLMIAPFLGDPAIAIEVRDQGGLAKWKSPEKVEQLTPDNYQRELWRWFQAVTTGAEKGPNIYLGWGSEDSLGRSAAVLGDELPAGHVFKVPGAHRWSTWKVILDQFLADSEFAKTCAP